VAATYVPRYIRPNIFDYISSIIDTVQWIGTHFFVKHGHWTDRDATLREPFDQNTVCEPTVIPYKHSGCRYSNTLSRSRALDQLNDTDDLRGRKGVIRHKGGPIRNGEIECEQRRTTYVAATILHPLKGCCTAPFAITNINKGGCPWTLDVLCIANFQLISAAKWPSRLKKHMKSGGNTAGWYPACF